MWVSGLDPEARQNPWPLFLECRLISNTDSLQLEAGAISRYRVRFCRASKWQRPRIPAGEDIYCTHTYIKLTVWAEAAVTGDQSNITCNHGMVWLHETTGRVIFEVALFSHVSARSLILLCQHERLLVFFLIRACVLQQLNVHHVRREQRREELCFLKQYGCRNENMSEFIIFFHYI